MIMQRNHDKLGAGCYTCTVPVLHCQDLYGRNRLSQYACAACSFGCSGLHTHVQHLVHATVDIAIFGMYSPLSMNRARGTMQGGQIAEGRKLL